MPLNAAAPSALRSSALTARQACRAPYQLRVGRFVPCGGRALSASTTASRPSTAASAAASPPPPPPPSFETPYRRTIPNLALGPHSRILVQGFTGKASTFHVPLSQSLGTQFVGGTSSKRGVTHHLDLPVFATVREAERALGYKPDASVVFVPPTLAADAILEAVEEEIPLVVSVAEGIPLRDQVRVMAALHASGQDKSRLLGANSPGYCNPRGARLGISPVAAAMPGCVGIAARSGTLSYEAMGATKDHGLGQSYVLGLGGDYYPGTRTDEALEFLLSDPSTKGIILIGEVGGTMEEDVCAFLASRTRATETPAKPIVGFVAGLNVPPFRSYGHAGAVWTERDGASAQRKREMWEKAGIRCAQTVEETAVLMKRALEERGAI